jgi:hypothetical protein
VIVRPPLPARCEGGPHRAGTARAEPARAYALWGSATS